jgi:hypothetical protein
LVSVPSTFISTPVRNGLTTSTFRCRAANTLVNAKGAAFRCKAASIDAALTASVVNQPNEKGLG